jgi:hypothetical protein
VVVSFLHYKFDADRSGASEQDNVIAAEELITYLVFCHVEDADLVLDGKASEAEHLATALRCTACADFNFMAVAFIIKQCVVASDFFANRNIANCDGLVGDFVWCPR